jgi:uncharacterized membrane protein YphA (DoxX/SURF4 family)
MLIRRIARPLLAGVFIAGGIAALRDLKSHAELVGPPLEPALDMVAKVVPVEQLPSTITLLKVDAGIKIGAGLLLATGKAPRLASGALAATLVPTTVVGHRFWEIDDPEQRMNHQVHFMKNLGLLGGLLLAAADTGGKPSLTWRARRASKTSAATAELLHRDITEGASDLSKRAGELTGQLTGQAADTASRYGSQAADLAGKAGKRLAKRRELARAQAEKLSARAGKRAEHAAKRARKAGKQAKKVGRKVSKQLR